jgi:hypothetical protein
MVDLPAVPQNTVMLTASGVLLVLSMSAGGSVAMAATPVASANVVDYDVAFAQAFPGSGNEHRITDWTLYAALVAGDLVTYGGKVDPAIMKRVDAAKAKPYQMQQVEMSLKRDARLVAAFNDQRHRIRSMILYADGGGFADDKCRRVLVYVKGEFRLVLGEGNDGGDRLSHATIAPGCPSTLDRGFQITAGRSSRFKCWPTESVTQCGWALPDMPAALKSVIETDYPGSMTLRWRWRGLGDVVHTRYVDAMGNRVASHESVALTVPAELSLEFVDPRGHLLWTAPAAGIAGRSR